ncbi:hypothetical protein QTP81_05420 [Alteromonas sp. ASW11-36]|uniref:WD40 repeat domain-containing protein n=1 Tax=Alteromonas arenosi TaxID=3055817 RepID=A0ABT7SV15_9ALTE|nr:hypothetical protein [Alteromonas sp. ASW11-36]MDM7860032.1 hypothetical protein [Alteromonas sp. ASW11-36]
MAQTAPAEGSDIWLIDYATSRDNPASVYRPLTWQKITDAPYYHNQPYFSADQQFLYYTAADAQQQTDLWRYELSKQEHINLTSSTTSEYSPTPLPSADGLSGIWVDEQGKQWLRAWSLNGQPPTKLLNVEPIGYHVWLNDGEVLVFVLGSGETPVHTLQRHTVKGATKRTEATVIDTNIGASLWAIPGKPGKFSYSKTLEGRHWLMAYDSNTGAIETLAELPAESSYYAWTPDGHAVTVAADEKALIRYDGQQWQTLFTIDSHCNNGATRLVFAPQGNKLALVCGRP